jgi:hypothetical protein
MPVPHPILNLTGGYTGGVPHGGDEQRKRSHE